MTARCKCGGMVPSTGNFCGFLDHAAQLGARRCELKDCAVSVPSMWLQHYELKAQFQDLSRRFTTSQDPTERAALAAQAQAVATRWAALLGA